MSSYYAPLSAVTEAVNDNNIRQVVVIETRRGWQHQVQSIRTEIQDGKKNIHVTLSKWRSEERKCFRYKAPDDKENFTIFNIVYTKIGDDWYCLLGDDQAKLYLVVFGKEILNLYASGKLFDRHES